GVRLDAGQGRKLIEPGGPVLVGEHLGLLVELGLDGLRQLGLEGLADLREALAREGRGARGLLQSLLLRLDRGSLVHGGLLLDLELLDLLLEVGHLRGRVLGGAQLGLQFLELRLGRDELLVAPVFDFHGSLSSAWFGLCAWSLVYGLVESGDRVLKNFKESGGKCPLDAPRSEDQSGPGEADVP